MTYQDRRLDVLAPSDVDFPASRPASDRIRPLFDRAGVLTMVLAALLTLGLHFALDRADQGADRTRLAVALGID